VGSTAQRCCWVPAAGTARAKAPWRRAKLLGGLLRITPDRTGPGDIWLCDVGASIWEAVYRIPAGAKGVNLRWPAYEGSHDSRFNPRVPPPAERLTLRHELFELGPA
jgi:hypothetical protein